MQLAHNNYVSITAASRAHMKLWREVWRAFLSDDMSMLTDAVDSIAQWINLECGADIKSETARINRVIIKERSQAEHNLARIEIATSWK